MSEKRRIRKRYQVAWKTKRGRTVVESLATRLQMVDRALTVARRTNRGVQLFRGTEPLGFVFGS